LSNTPLSITAEWKRKASAENFTEHAATFHGFDFIKQTKEEFAANLHVTSSLP
jgi:hypothetical protein